MPIVAMRPSNTEYAPFYASYVASVPDGDIVEMLESQHRETVEALRGISEERAGVRYAPEKWSIREVVSHLSDAERVFSHRALYFARGGAEPLPSMDEGSWVALSNADQRTLPDLAAEFAAVRGATVALFRSFTDGDFERAGIASSNLVSVRALAWIMAGHERHHLRILRERYGV